MLSKWLASTDRKTAWPAVLALLLSLMLHALLFGLTNFDLDMFEGQADKVYVRFAAVEPAAPPAPVAEIKPEPLPPEPQLPRPPESPPVVPAEIPPAVDMTAAESAIEPELQEAPVEDALPQEAVVESGTEAAIEPDAGEVSAEIEPLALPSPVEGDVTPYQFVESEYDILRGADGYKIGQSKVRYEARGDGTYLLESRSEAKGFASWFISGSLLQRSEGLVTEYGLQPHSFIYQYGSGSKTRQAVLDWERRRITLETDKGSKSSRLPAGTQDLMSFMYQFMYVPPLREMMLNITNGKRLKAYSYSFVGEVDLSTKMGVMRAIHIENINDDGDEKTELWLALEYNFLPVKIRKTEEDGSVIEQVITHINTELLQ